MFEYQAVIDHATTYLQRSDGPLGYSLRIAVSAALTSLSLKGEPGGMTATADKYARSLYSRHPHVLLNPIMPVYVFLPPVSRETMTLAVAHSFLRRPRGLLQVVVPEQASLFYMLFPILTTKRHPVEVRLLLWIQIAPMIFESQAGFRSEVRSLIQQIIDAFPLFAEPGRIIENEPLLNVGPDMPGLFYALLPHVI